MNSTLHNYSSPIKILLLLFTLLLTFEVAINYFSSSSISIIRFHKNNNRSLEVDKSNKDVQNSKLEIQSSSNQLDYYDDSRNEWIYTKDSSNKSVLSYIRKNCNTCANSQLVNNYHHYLKCPKQPSILQKEDYCQYLYLKLIHEYSFPSLLSSIISLLSGRINTSLNYQRKNISSFPASPPLPPTSPLLSPSPSKCFNIRPQVSKLSVLFHHTQKPTSLPSVNKNSVVHVQNRKTTSRRGILTRYINYNVIYSCISELQEFLGNRLDNLTIYTSKNLICINTKSKVNGNMVLRPVTLERNKSITTSHNNNNNNNSNSNNNSNNNNANNNNNNNNNYVNNADQYILSAKDHKITYRKTTSSQDIPRSHRTNIKVSQSSSFLPQNKFFQKIYTLFTNQTFLYLFNILVTIVKGLTLIYLINIVKVNIYAF